MKILLINSPTNKLYRPAESLGIGYIAAALREEDYEVELYDTDLMWNTVSINERLECLVSRLENIDYDIVAFSVIDDSYLYTKTIIKALEDKKIVDKVDIILGGYLPTFADEQILNEVPSINYVIRGEGERSFLELVKCIRGENLDGLSLIKGVTYRENNELVRNPMPDLIENLDDLPFPARDNIRYLIERDQAISISSSRGCIGNCIYCAIASFYKGCNGDKWRFRSAKNVIDEIELIVNTHNVSKFMFIDDEFIGKDIRTERVYELADEIKKRDLKITFEIFCRADSVEKETMMLLKEAGLSQVFLGIETSLDKRLKLLGKGIKSAEQVKAMDNLDEWGIDYIIGFIPMDPFILLEEVKQEFEFLRKQQDRPFFHGNPSILSRDIRLLPYYGTPFQRLLEKKGILQGSFPIYNYEMEDKRVDVLFKILSSLENKELNEKFHCSFDDIPENLRGMGESLVSKVVKRRKTSELEFVGRIINIIEANEQIDANNELLQAETQNYVEMLNGMINEMHNLKKVLLRKK